MRRLGHTTDRLAEGFGFEADLLDELAIPSRVPLCILEPVAQTLEPIESCTQIGRIEFGHFLLPHQIFSKQVSIPIHAFVPRQNDYSVRQDLYGPRMN
jgi:hypothetical protein